MCGVAIPNWYHELFDGLDDDPATRQLLTATTAAELTSKLRDYGVKNFHFYTLNKADLAFMACKILGLRAQGKAA